VCNEKALLSECSHPFILSLIRTFQDRDSLYMLLEFVQGGELFSIMQRKFRFPMYPTFFYSACLVDVFEHLHGRHIVYRDLKPENVLIDRTGYLKLADFGFAKRIMDKSFTLCGTPEYLAPEVVLGTGHNKAVDYWGLGILIYEMLVGISPFADDYENDQHVLGNNIVNSELSYDKFNKAVIETESKSDSFWIAPPQSSSFCMSQVTKRLANAGRLPAEDLVRKLLTKVKSSLFASPLFRCMCVCVCAKESLSALTRYFCMAESCATLGKHARRGARYQTAYFFCGRY